MQSTGAGGSLVHMQSHKLPMRPFDPNCEPADFVAPGEQYTRDKPQNIIYRFYGADRELIYLGRTGSDPTFRWKQHRKNSAWWPLAAFVSIERVDGDRDQLDAIEKAAIRAEHPRFNKIHTKSRSSFMVFPRDGVQAVVETFRTYLLPEDFAALVAAFKAEGDSDD